MANEYKDLIVDEPDGIVRYDFVDRAGNVVIPDVMLRISSTILQKGDSFGATEMNAFIERNEDGTVKTSKFYTGEEF